MFFLLTFLYATSTIGTPETGCSGARGLVWCHKNEQHQNYNCLIQGSRSRAGNTVHCPLRFTINVKSWSKTLSRKSLTGCLHHMHFPGIWLKQWVYHPITWWLLSVPQKSKFMILLKFACMWLPQGSQAYFDLVFVIYRYFYGFSICSCLGTKQQVNKLPQTEQHWFRSCFRTAFSTFKTKWKWLDNQL